MPTGFRNGNGNMQGYGRMQRVPSRQHQSAPAEPERREREEPSPIVNMARRIRDEQGVSGLRDFLSAMEPFAAPNELRSLASRFGMDYDEIRERRRERAENERDYGSRNGMNQNGRQGGMNGGFGPDPQILQMMQAMQMMNGMGGMQGQQKRAANTGGQGNPMQLMQLMQMLPMLRGMMNGGADISQLMKMMGG